MQAAASSRSFGLLVAIIFFALAGLSYCAHGRLYPYWGTLSAGFLALAIAAPRVLAPLKRLWIRLGHVLHVIVGPIVLGLSYVIAIVPVGILTRLFGKDLLAQ